MMVFTGSITSGIIIVRKDNVFQERLGPKRNNKCHSLVFSWWASVGGRKMGDERVPVIFISIFSCCCFPR
ncbi:Uncharacterized protein APZ42_025726 [Daphnia magna]|uniref:Uncharacterized protein n=1 Tax=Daphnia magna TaxID=35525 RepID=A0A0P5JQA1_9CRUS|nr:Uncharacterized protein APZ42_025726 [Daphnia magna]